MIICAKRPSSKRAWKQGNKNPCRIIQHRYPRCSDRGLRDGLLFGVSCPNQSLGSVAVIFRLDIANKSRSDDFIVEVLLD